FSLGAVLYEMLSGRRAFPGASVVESGYAIVHDEPAPLPPELPPALVQVVRRCLEKEPPRRFQTGSDLAFALELLLYRTGSTRPVEPRQEGIAWRRRGWLAAVVAALLVGSLAAAVLRGRAPAAGVPGPGGAGED